jgi:hypothetical protein
MALERGLVHVVDAVDAALAAAIRGIRGLGRPRWKLVFRHGLTIMRRLASTAHAQRTHRRGTARRATRGQAPKLAIATCFS